MRFTRRPMTNVIATADVMVTRFATTRRFISIPDRKDRSIDTTTIMLPAVSADGKTVVAPASTGSTGTSAPAK